MSTLTDQRDLRAFHEFLGKKLQQVAESVTPEEALDEWRALHPDEAAFEEDVAAVKEALDDLANGDPGMPVDEFLRDFQKRHGLKSES